MKVKTSQLIFAQGILFVVFLFLSAWFNRFSADDYFFIGKIRDFSFLENYQKLYLTWNGRWTYNFAILFFIQFNYFKYFLFAFNILSFILLLYSIYLALYALNMRYDARFETKKLISTTLVFIGVFFFFTHHPGQSWFWISASLAYLWSCIFFLLALSCWVKKKHSFLDYFLIIFSCLYIGGSNEVLAILTILLIFSSFFSKENRLLKVISFFSILLSFCLNYFSIGTTFRDGLTPNLSFIDLILYVGYGTVKYLLLDFYKTILPAIIFGLPFFILGRQTSIQFRKNFVIKKELLYTLLFIVVITVTNQFIVIYALGGLAPDRATIATSLLGSLALVRILFLYGNHSKELKVNYKIIIGIVVLLLLIFNIVFFSIHQTYTHSVDIRMTNILTNSDSVIKVEKLKNSGYLNSAEITSDTTNFLNQHLKYGLGINQQIVLDEN